MVDKPNICFIILDTLRYDYAKFMPEWDAITKLGWNFERMYAPSTFTFANMCSMRTGLYPPRHNWRTWPNGGPLCEDAPLLENALSDAGYFVANTLEVPYRPAETLTWMDKVGDLAEKSPFFVYLHYNSIHNGAFKARFKTGIPVAHYKNLVVSAGHWLQDVFAKFRQADAYDNALFVIVGDHGVGLESDKLTGEGMDVGAGQVYDFRVRTPCVMFGPQIETSVFRGAYSHIDIPAELMDRCAIYTSHGIVGDDIAFCGSSSLVYLEAQSPHSIWPSPVPNVFGATDGRIKVMVTPEGVKTFDLVDDPGETTDRPDLFRQEFVDFIEAVKRDVCKD